MPRPKFRSKQKNGGHGAHKKQYGKKPKRPDIDKVGRKYRFMQQNQENEETLRRQQDLEKRYLERNADPSRANDDEAESCSEDENRSGGLDELISTFKSDQAAADDAIESDNDGEAEDDSEDEEDQAIEDEDDEDDEDGEDGEDDEADEDDEDDDDSGDDVFPEKFEEQSQPRGRKYRSSDEENSEDDEKDADSDDLPEDTEQILLRPEEFDEEKQHFDGIFSNNSIFVGPCI